MLEHFNHHCQYHVVPCPRCGQDLAHKDIISHLDSSSCLVAAEQGRETGGCFSNVSVVPVEAIQTFQNNLKENTEKSRDILTKISEVRVADESNAGAFKQAQHEIKAELRELRETQARISEETKKMSLAYLNYEGKFDALRGEVASGNGKVGNTLLKVEELIDEYKTEATTSGKALVDMKEDINDKLNKLEVTSKEIFFVLRRESEPLEWSVPDWSKLKEKARGEGNADCEAEKASLYAICGYKPVI